jgi:hypothetical protein
MNDTNFSTLTQLAGPYPAKKLLRDHLRLFWQYLRSPSFW